MDAVEWTVAGEVLCGIAFSTSLGCWLFHPAAHPLSILTDRVSATPFASALALAVAFAAALAEEGIFVLLGEAREEGPDSLALKSLALSLPLAFALEPAPNEAAHPAVGLANELPEVPLSAMVCP